MENFEYSRTSTENDNKRVLFKSFSTSQSPSSELFNNKSDLGRELFNEKQNSSKTRILPPIESIVKEDLRRLVDSIPDKDLEKSFKSEMDEFYLLFIRFLEKKSSLDWTSVKNLSPNNIISHKELKASLMRESTKQPEIFSDQQTCSFSESTAGGSDESEFIFHDKSLLDSLAILKLNGGLGTTMGCVGPKSAIEVRENQTFLDLIITQIETLNIKNSVDVPLILMNSFNTDLETKNIIQKYYDKKISIITFNQSKFPRIYKDDFMIAPSRYVDADKFWYPPGHGDLFNSLKNTGLLNKLISEGKEYLFISNVDNLGATVDEAILKYMRDSNIDFIMEVTDKSKADIKGGTLIEYNGKVQLLEISQVPSKHLDDFTNLKHFNIFNTNNTWISLKALQDILDRGPLSLDIICNLKIIESTCKKVIQLETALGSAIQHFPLAKAINVPRSRFLPVKNCSDLFLIQSDLYSVSYGTLKLNPKRKFPTVPTVKLGDYFKNIQSYLSRFESPPHILELDHLTVSGDVKFGTNITLKGTVIIVANHDTHIDIPSGSVFFDKVISGNLRILDH